ncbi:MAG: CobW family GTP-binding protein [Bacillota bacterium]|nr:CobW family GTP-binding protein [Bacillota bacterium]
MTKIDIVSGFLGAGKTTLIKKLLAEALANTQVVLIENEFGEIGIDGGFLKEAGIEIKEMNSGCICCSLVGDFGASLKEVMNTYKPERILIEPSGVGKLSDVMKAVQDVIDGQDVVLNSAVAVVDASKCKMYIKNFGEFFINQIEHAGTIILSRTGDISEEKLNKAIELIREHNEKAVIITTPWDELEGTDILETIEGAKDLEAELMAEIMEHRHEDEEHEHHHHHDGEEHEHHHHDHGPDCTCGCHDHEHGHHHADEVFTSWGMETPAAYSRNEIENILDELDDEGKYGFVLRAKGMVPGTEGGWIYFDYVPGESNVREGKPDVTGKFCVIGSKLNEDALHQLFAR